MVTAEDGTTSRTYTVTVNRAAGTAPSAAVVSTDPSSLTEKNLHGAKVVVSLTGVVFVAGIPDPDHFELATVEASGVAVDGVERIPDYRDRGRGEAPVRRHGLRHGRDAGGDGEGGGPRRAAPT